MDLKLDIHNIPKYCPQCQQNGLKSKVKKFRLEPSEPKVVMCINGEVRNIISSNNFMFNLIFVQCAWPLSHNSEEEIRVPEADMSFSSSSSTSGKKRKKEKHKVDNSVEDSVVLGDSLSVTLDKLETDKCKSPNSKKLKLTSDNISANNTDDNSCSPSLSVSSLESKKSKRLGSKEKDIINYINENFNNSPKPVEPSEVIKECDNEDKNLGDADADVFKAVPVAVRQPLRIPKHASNILSSRHIDSEKQETLEETAAAKLTDDCADDDDDDANSDPEMFVSDDDSELESLVSECSTMTAASEVSVEAGGEGTGKKKRRGKKKNRKDRRQRHAGKCSKEGPRQSDLSMLMTEDNDVTLKNDEEENEEEIKVNEFKDHGFETAEVSNTTDNVEETIKSDENTPECEVKPSSSTPASAMSTSSVRSSVNKTKSAMSVVSAASSMSIESDSGIVKTSSTLSGMSVTPDTKEKSVTEIKSTEPIKTRLDQSEEPITVTPETDPPDIVVESPEDDEMEDLSKFQLKWGNLDPLSPMSAGSPAVADDQELNYSEVKSMRKLRYPKQPVAEAEKQKSVKALEPRMSATVQSENTEKDLFKQPQTLPVSSRPVSHPTLSSSSAKSSPLLSSSTTKSVAEDPKYSSLPDLSSSPVSEKKSDNLTVVKQKPVKNNKGLSSIVNNLSQKKEESIELELPVVSAPKATLPDGPYPRRRGRKSVAKKFTVTEEENIVKEPEPSEPPQPPAPAPVISPKRRGRPPKSSQTVSEPVKEKSPQASPSSTTKVQRSPKLVPCDPPTLNGKVKPNLVPCSGPPPGIKLVPCQPPKHLLNKIKPLNTPVTSVPAVKKSSLFDLDDEVDQDDIVGRVQKALEKQNAEANKSIPEPPLASSSPKVLKPNKTFSRVPKKPVIKEDKEIVLSRSIDISTTLVNQEPCLDINTLTIPSFETEDPDYALVKKLGTGRSRDQDLITSIPESLVSSSSPAKQGGNAVVFHVANQAMINQPTGSSNVEVKEHGHTKVMLTGDSNLIEVHDLKKAIVRQRTSAPVSRGRCRGRGSTTVSRFFEREGITPPQPAAEIDLPPEPVIDNFGDGWFTWRDWRVHPDFLEQFEKHIEELVEKNKHRVRSLPFDLRISALLIEKEFNHTPQLQKTIDFFSEVFIKYLYMKSKYKILPDATIINILRTNYVLDNAQFANQIKDVLDNLQQQKVDPRASSMPLPEAARANMIKAAQPRLSDQHQVRHPQGAHQHQVHPQVVHQVNKNTSVMLPPPSPAQPINLSISATDVPLPPSPPSPPPSVQSIAPPSVQSVHHDSSSSSHQPVKIKTELVDPDSHDPPGSVSMSHHPPGSVSMDHSVFPASVWEGKRKI